MSARALSCAWEQTPKTTSQKLVLAALADRSDDDGLCFPSLTWLSEKCSPMPKETTRRVLRELSEQGYVTKTQRKRREDGSFSTWLLQLDLQNRSPMTNQRALVTTQPACTGERTVVSFEVSTKDLPTTDASHPPSAPTSDQTIVADFIDQAREQGIDPPKRTVGQLARNIGELVKEGHSEETIKAGLARMMERRVVQPALLSNFVMEAALPASTHTKRFGRGLTVKQILAGDYLAEETP